MKRLILPFVCLVLSGCVSVELAAVDDADYRVLESGQARTFHVASVFSHARLFPAAGRFDVVLVEQLPSPGHRGQLMRLRNDTVPWRRLERLARAVEPVSKQLPPGRARWVVSINPLVVAADARDDAATDAGGYPALGDGQRHVRPAQGLRLITPADLGRTVAGVFEVENAASGSSGDNGGAGTRPQPSLVPIVVPASTTLGELMATRPWVRAPVARDFSSPLATYTTYLLAIRADDEAAAVACWYAADDNRSGALDVVVGTSATKHRCVELLRQRFGAAAAALVAEEYPYTNAGIDRALRRLPDAKVQTTAGTATLTIPWRDEDTRPEGQSPFEFSTETREFRRVNGQWKIDFAAATGLKDPSDFFTAGSWGPIFAAATTLTRETNRALERGQYKTVDDFKAAVASGHERLRKQFESTPQGR